MRPYTSACIPLSGDSGVERFGLDDAGLMAAFATMIDLAAYHLAASGGAMAAGEDERFFGCATPGALKGLRLDDSDSHTATFRMITL